MNENEKRSAEAATMHSTERAAAMRHNGAVTVDAWGRARNQWGGEPGYQCLFTAEESERWRREMAR